MAWKIRKIPVIACTTVDGWWKLFVGAFWWSLCFSFQMRLSASMVSDIYILCLWIQLTLLTRGYDSAHAVYKSKGWSSSKIEIINLIVDPVLHLILNHFSFEADHFIFMLAESISKFGSGLFLLVQVVLLLDFVHRWNETWVGYDEQFWLVWQFL